MNFIKRHCAALACTVLAMVFALPAQAQSEHMDFVVKMYGEATAGVLSPNIAKGIADSGIDVNGYDCYQLPALDPATGRKLGDSVDCIRPVRAGGDAHGDGMQMEAYAFFFLPDGMIANHGCSSVRPFFDGIGDNGVTHMTGQIPMAEFGAARSPNTPEICVANPGTGIIYGTGAYKNATGHARLSGAFDMRKIASGKLIFTCLFVINLQKQANGSAEND